MWSPSLFLVPRLCGVPRCISHPDYVESLQYFDPRLCGGLCQILSPDLVESLATSRALSMWNPSLYFESLYTMWSLSLYSSPDYVESLAVSQAPTFWSPRCISNFPLDCCLNCYFLFILRQLPCTAQVFKDCIIYLFPNSPTWRTMGYSPSDFCG